MSKRVFITGWGIISALGNGVEENYEALVNEQSGISRPEILKTNYADQKFFGEIKQTNDQLRDLLGIDTKVVLSRTAMLGMIAAKEAVDTAKLSEEELDRALVLNGTSVGGMDITEKHYSSFLKEESLNFQEVFGGHDCGHSTESIAKYIGAKGETFTISTACSSSANTIMHGARMIKSGQTNIAIAGGTDALSVFTLNGFNSLKILDDNPCRPFDENRQGLNLGEGAAFIVLESEESVKNRMVSPIGELIGYGNANDAYHQTASSPEGNGAYNAMKQAMQIAGNPNIDYINAHGTGTGNNDMSESTSIKRLFGDEIPEYSSTKAYTGHTLGAAGSIEAVYSLLSISKGKVFPCLRVEQTMEVMDKKPTLQLMSKEINTVLSNSLGFGGNCSSLIFTR